MDEVRLRVRAMKVYAPWTPLQVMRLNRWQVNVRVHPFACPNHGDEGHRRAGGVLQAQTGGWVCPSCDYTQNWAHDFMLRWA